MGCTASKGSADVVAKNEPAEANPTIMIVIFMNNFSTNWRIIL